MLKVGNFLWQNCHDYLIENLNTSSIWHWLQRRNIKYWVCWNELLFTAMLPLAHTDTINCLIKPSLQLWTLLGSVICMQVIQILKKLVTFGNFSEITYYEFTHRTVWVWHKTWNICPFISVLRDHWLYISPENQWSANSQIGHFIYFL